MIKFAGTFQGSPVFGFGLTNRNLVQLRDGKPIHVDLDQMGGKGTIVIFFGDTESAIVEELRACGLVDAQTVIKADPALKDS